ncbi:MAG: nucleotidyltransferase family protein [Alistipes sp.]|jgi:hypothetical protein|nr:nucleotidyltransferase family protein [Alistipes sp.]
MTALKSNIVLAEILRHTLWGDSSPIKSDAFSSLSDGDWIEVHQLAVRQGIGAIAMDGIQRLELEIPRAIKMRFISSTDKIEKEYAKKRRIAKLLAETYAKVGIRMMILKGIGLSQLYPIANHRPSSDIDIYLCGEQQRGDKLLQTQYGVQIDKGRHHHTVFRIKNTLVENHYDFIEQHSRASSQAAERMLKEWHTNEEPLEAQIDGVTYLMPAPNMNALFLILHSGAHFAAENISIRHMLDWAFFLKTYGGKVDWKRIMNIGDEFGFRPFLDVMNTLCVEYLGMDRTLAPSLTYDRELIERAWNDSMQYKVKNIPNNFLYGWVYRIQRRYSNRWKQQLVYRDNGFGAIVRSAVTHLLPPSIIRKWR